MTRQRRRGRKRRANPSGGFLPGLLGFIAAPIAMGALAYGTEKVVASATYPGKIGRQTVIDLLGAVGAWASSPRDPGWHSFATGSAIGLVLAAVIARPLVIAAYGYPELRAEHEGARALP